jgi:hypothetical protein
MLGVTLDYNSFTRKSQEKKIYCAKEKIASRKEKRFFYFDIQLIKLIFGQFHTALRRIRGRILRRGRIIRRALRLILRRLGRIIPTVATARRKTKS